ncbi:hypothetical protein [Sphingobium sp. EM0848]|uniref:hypothetical protein n=1 Tax=Sphingobium sp. EM0848 TaxID=2743473 RepID=UPI002101ABD2|nr:hypothetical protein [Sphingobium sp. EM0848]
MPNAMRRLGYYLLCLLTASLLTTTVVHAREIPNGPTIECSGYVHTDSDSDQSQGDADKAMPHHHGSCHGSAAFVPMTASDALLPVPVDMPSRAPTAVVPKRWAIGPGLRPPIA